MGWGTERLRSIVDRRQMSQYYTALRGSCFGMRRRHGTATKALWSTHVSTPAHPQCRERWGTVPPNVNSCGQEARVERRRERGAAPQDIATLLQALHRGYRRSRPLYGRGYF
jgi:hypothetical protein